MRGNFCFRLRRGSSARVGNVGIGMCLTRRFLIRFTAPALSLTCGAREPDQVDATWCMLLTWFFCLTELPSRIKWKGIYRYWRTVFQNYECRAGLPGFTEQPHPLICSMSRWSAEPPLLQHPPLENEGRFFLQVLLWRLNGCPHVKLLYIIGYPVLRK